MVTWKYSDVYCSMYNRNIPQWAIYICHLQKHWVTWKLKWLHYWSVKNYKDLNTTYFQVHIVWNSKSINFFIFCVLFFDFILLFLLSFHQFLLLLLLQSLELLMQWWILWLLHYHLNTEIQTVSYRERKEKLLPDCLSTAKCLCKVNM